MRGLSTTILAATRRRIVVTRLGGAPRASSTQMWLYVAASESEAAAPPAQDKELVEEIVSMLPPASNLPGRLEALPDSLTLLVLHAIVPRGRAGLSVSGRRRAPRRRPPSE